MLHTPNTAEDVAEIIRGRTKPFSVEGLGTKQTLGHGRSHEVLSLKKLSGVTLYEPEELVLEAKAATPFKDIVALLEKHNQHLAFDPPDYSKLFYERNSGSIASLLTCNLSGPRRLTQGAARDHILGVSGVSGRGEIFKGGGRVVKNVTGYDIPKLMAGSYGTLAALTSVTFKVLPKPEAECSIIIPCTDYLEAGKIMRKALQQSVDVSCAAFQLGIGVVLRLEGIESSVADRSSRLLKTLDSNAEKTDAPHSQKLWRSIRNLEDLADKTTTIWRVSVAPTHGAMLATVLQNTYGAKILLDWCGGLMWVEMPEEYCAVNIRDHITTGHAMLFRATPEVKRVVDVFHPQSADLAKLSQRVKQSFDPAGILNPGRMNRNW